MQAADVLAKEAQFSSELQGVRAELQRALLVNKTLDEQSAYLKLRVRQSLLHA